MYESLRKYEKYKYFTKTTISPLQVHWRTCFPISTRLQTVLVILVGGSRRPRSVSTWFVHFPFRLGVLTTAEVNHELELRL